MQVVISPQSLLEKGIRVEKVDDLRLFKFTDDLQDKLKKLLTKNQTATLTDTEQGERSIREARALWLEAGWHPPKTDPRQLEV
jgi:hypothetical protein